MERYAIVGFGTAGYHAAKAIRQRSADAHIHIFSDENTGPSNPMLATYFVKDAIPYEAMFPYGTAEDICKKMKLIFHPNQPVVGMDGKNRKLFFADGSSDTFDKILISTGAAAIMPPLPGIDLPGVFKMRTVQDAVDLKSRLRTGRVCSALVIGASWVGIKVIEDLISCNISCTLVDGAERVFCAATFPETARRIEKDLYAKGVVVSCGQMLTQIIQEPDGRLTAVMAGGDRFTADIIGVCIGVSMNVKFLQNSGLTMKRGIITDCYMRSNCENIYAAGDCCEVKDIQTDQAKNIGLWANAIRQGTVAGVNMAGGCMEYGGSGVVNLAHYLNYDFVSIGDLNTCTLEDQIYEYEDCRYYIRASRNAQQIHCINIIGDGGVHGIIKNVFVKSLECPCVQISLQMICALQSAGIPESFIHFLEGK